MSMITITKKSILLCSVLGCLMFSVNASAIEKPEFPVSKRDISRIAASYRLSESLLQAIAWTETTYNPYALNLQSRKELDKGLKSAGIKFRKASNTSKSRFNYAIYPTTQKEATQILRKFRPKCVGYDVGLFQISKGKMIDYGVSSESLLDPIENTKLAAEILQKCQILEKSLWRTIECYHHGTAKKELTRYSDAVYRAYLQLSLL